MPRKSVEERFWEKVSKGGECWEWTAARSPLGYGRFRLDGKTWNANRLAYVLTKGPIPEGYVVMHSCDNPPCVNPDHLSVGTHADNVADKVAKGRNSNRYKNATHCIHGHEFTEENTYLYRTPKGGIGRKCKKCTGVRAKGLTP